MPEEWIVWNRYHGIVQRAVISDLRPWKRGASGQLDGLEYDDIGRIPHKSPHLDRLEIA